MNEIKNPVDRAANLLAERSQIEATIETTRNQRDEADANIGDLRRRLYQEEELKQSLRSRIESMTGELARNGERIGAILVTLQNQRPALDQAGSATLDKLAAAFQKIGAGATRSFITRAVQIAAILLLSLAVGTPMLAAAEPFVVPRSSFASPAISITTGAADTAITNSLTAREGQVYWRFATVAGSYSTCTVQAQTTIDGANFVTLGSPVSVTVATNAVNVWTIIGQLGTTAVTTSSVSSTAATSFGGMTKFSFACSGGYGTSAPAAITVVYK